MKWITYLAMTAFVMAGGWAERALAVTTSGTHEQVLTEVVQTTAGGAAAGQADEGDQEWGQPEAEPDLANPDEDLDVPSPDEPEEGEDPPADNPDAVPPAEGQGGAGQL